MNHGVNGLFNDLRARRDETGHWESVIDMSEWVSRSIVKKIPALESDGRELSQ